MADSQNKVIKDGSDTTILITVKDDGAMGLELGGNPKLPEVIGILTTTLMDIHAKHFIVPYLNEQSAKIAEAIASNSAEELSLEDSLSQVSELNDSMKGINSLIKSFKSMQQEVGA